MPAARLKIFINSIQNGFTDIRRDLKASNSMPLEMRPDQTVLLLHLMKIRGLTLTLDIRRDLKASNTKRVY